MLLFFLLKPTGHQLEQVMREREMYYPVFFGGGGLMQGLGHGINAGANYL